LNERAVDRRGRVSRVRRVMSKAFAVMLAAAVLALSAAATRAQDMPVFAIEFKDGVITPLRLEVPAKRAFKIELHNTGNTPAEFESIELHREKVLAPQSTSFIVFRTLDPGEYKFFDDFHPDAPQAVLVAK
jgi:Cupredoxin-like domain